MSTDLFSDFQEVSAKQWKQKIQYDLKGADYNQTLVWKSNDGVSVKPFYHPDETVDPAPVKPPQGWSICEKIYAAAAGAANKKASEALEKGAESLWFIIPSEEIELETLFSGLDLQKSKVFLKMQFLSDDFLLKLQKMLKEKASQVYIQNDIIGKLARSGNWFGNLQDDFASIDAVLKQVRSFGSVLSVDTGLYQNAGATIPQQLAYSMAHATEYLNHLNNSGQLQMDQGKDLKLQFLVSTGPNYFFEIAKLRSLRLLYASLATEFDVPGECVIIAQPSKRNKTLYDFNVNLLRTTTECMSAVLGGADSICNMPYDALYHKDNEFGARIARNQLLILKHESYFEKVANPAEGSYYIETLTQQFAEEALAIFKDIERGGGFLKQLKEGTIQKKIAESAIREQEQYDKEEIVLVGTNKYINKEDKMKQDLELYPFLKRNPRKTLIQPVLERRLSEKTEQERLNLE